MKEEEEVDHFYLTNSVPILIPNAANPLQGAPTNQRFQQEAGQFSSCGRLEFRLL